MSKFKGALRGFISGAVATGPMTAVFWGARRAELIEEVPPHKAIRSVTPNAREPQLSWMSGIAHVLVGGGAGALYGAVVPPRRQGLGSGTLFGLGVWVVGYEAVMPAATEIAPAHRDKPSRSVTILVAHVIYGAVLGLAMSRRTLG